MASQFNDFKDLHKSQTIIVCGCGQSLNDLSPPINLITIGVNDVGRHFTPDYLVVLNSKNQFKGDRFQFVENSKAKALFTQLNLNIKHQNIVRFPLGKRGDTDFSGRNGLPFTRNSPYVAVCLAAFMGAKRIGLIGVDFTEHHFFSRTGRHPLTRQLHHIDSEYQRLALELNKSGVELFNLSEISQLKKLPRKRLSEFTGIANPADDLSESRDAVSSLDRVEAEKIRRNCPAARCSPTCNDMKNSQVQYSRAPPLEIDWASGAAEKLNVVHLSTTNCAGAFWNLSAMLRQYGGINSRVITASNRTNGRVYEKDVLLSNHLQVRRLLEQADIIHFHNWLDKSSPQLQPWRSIIQNKPALLQFHSEFNVLQPSFQKSDLRKRNDIPTIVVAQKQARDYPNAIPVPNALDIYNPKLLFAKGPGHGKLKVIYTPTDLKSYRDNKDTCRGKGYSETRQVLTELQRAGVIDVNISTSIPWEQLVELRSTADVLIDECVTGGYHLTSLEGLAQGMATIAHLDRQTIELLCRITGSAPEALPWVNCQVKDLAHVLKSLANNPKKLADIKAHSRAWMEQFWHPTQVVRHYLAAYSVCLGRSAYSPDRAEPCLPISADKTLTTKGTISMANKTSVKKRTNSISAIAKSITYDIGGQKNPKRSEDFPQFVKLSKKLLAQKNRFKGKPCHILGNGPSVNEIDLSLLDSRLVIGVNASTLLDTALGRAADFYCVTDRRFLERRETSVLAKKSKSTRVFAGYCHGLIPGNDINYVKICGGDGISDDIEHGFYHCCSVALFAAQLGIWLGSTEIYLHGCEYDYGKERFYDELHPAPHDTHIYPRVEKSASLLTNYLRAKGGSLFIVGKSRLLGDFGGSAIKGIAKIDVKEFRNI